MTKRHLIKKTKNKTYSKNLCRSRANDNDRCKYDNDKLMTINKVVFIINSAKLSFAVRARGKQDKPRVKYVKALVRRKRNVCTHQPCCDSDKREFEKPDVALLDPMSRPVPSSLLPSKC